MNDKLKNIAVTALCGLWIFAAAIWGLVSSDAEISLSERRKLAQFPEISAEALSSGSFMSGFEKYAADQFPLRDGFRRLKAIGEFYIFRQLDSNGIYLKNGYASKLEFPLKEEAVKNAAEKFRRIYDLYLSGSGGKVYLSVIPDKNFFLAEAGGYPSIDFERLVGLLRENTEFAEYIDIFPTLEIEDYYRTDTHWRQEKIVDTAKALAEGMGAKLDEEYEEITLEKPFYGVYYGQSALPLSGEKMIYLDSPIFDGVSVYNLEEDSCGGVYDLERANGADPYELFLSGPRSLMVIENPNAETDRELVIFRDSFGSSIAPLFAEAYKKITLIDIRYLPTMSIKYFADFEGADALFLYSTSVLNNSETLQ